MIRTALLAVTFWLLAGCAGGADPQLQPEDRDLVRAMRLARVAFDSGNYRQAAALYGDAAAYAEARDDAWAIADAHYGAGASLLRQRQEMAALAEVEAAREALALVDAQPFAELRLLEATVRYRLGQLERVSELVGPLRREQEPVIAGRAIVLDGLLASDGGDAEALAQDLVALRALHEAGLAADEAELEGRLQLLQDQPGAAVAAFQRAAELRRDELDYEGMTRALAAAAAASEAATELPQAAELYLRAGRSAAARDQPEAGDWLRSAELLAERAGRPELAQEARERLQQWRSTGAG